LIILYNILLFSTITASQQKPPIEQTEKKEVPTEDQFLKMKIGAEVGNF